MPFFLLDAHPLISQKSPWTPPPRILCDIIEASSAPTPSRLQHRDDRRPTFFSVGRSRCIFDASAGTPHFTGYWLRHIIYRVLSMASVVVLVCRWLHDFFHDAHAYRS